MLIQHKVKMYPAGNVIVVKEEVREVNFGSVKQPSDVIFFEYDGVRT